MTKVEHMRDALCDNMSKEWCATIDSLIAAAHEEGKDELQAIFDILWNRMRTWEAEWRAENPKERRLTSPDSIQLIEWKIAKSREEGGAEERERIRKAAKFTFDQTGKGTWRVDVSLLAPDKESK
jgi:hypothetical protein